MNRNCGQTHHTECWRQHGHSACAEREMARLQERYDLAVKKNGEQFYKIERLEGALREIAASELSSGGQLRMLAREALDKDQI